MNTTSTEFFEKDNGLFTPFSVKDKNGDFTPVVSIERAIEFAKLKVAEALLMAADNAEAIEGWNTGFSGSAASVDRDSIINSFPLDNII